MTDLRTDRPWIVFLFLFSLFIFTRSLSLHGVEYRDDEIFYFESAKEMLHEGNLFSPTYFGENRFQKPILFYWFVILSYKLFGVNWFAARLSSAVFAALSICFAFLLARRFFSRRVSLLSGFILMSLPLFLRHAKVVVPDMALQFFILAAIYFGVSYAQDTQKKKRLYLFYVMSALGFMIKGPAALVVPLGTMIIFILGTRKVRVKDLEFAKGLGIWAVIILPWFLFMIAVHGRGYFEYMVVEETKNRIVGYDKANFLLAHGIRVLKNVLFYCRTLLAYFSPWFLIGLAGFPVLVSQWKKIGDGREKEGLVLCLGWILLVFTIFSSIYFRISHYLLPICAPFSIALSYFMLDLFKNDAPAQGQVTSFLNISILFFLGIGFFMYGFLFVVLAQQAQGWIVVLVLVYLAILLLVIKRPRPAYPAFILSLFITFLFSQSSVLDHAGVTSHGPLQRFAQTIHRQAHDPFVIGVGSHDIHEKEFQVYFDSPIIKTGHSHKPLAEIQLRALLDRKEEVYCLLTQNDYNDYSSILGGYTTEVLEREFMVRKRMQLDKGFLRAFLKLDGTKVREYLLEEIVLVRRK